MKTIVFLTNESRTIYMNPYFNFTLLKEKTNDYFNVSETTLTRLTIYGDSETYEYNFNVSDDSEDNNKAYYPINITWKLMQLNIEYNDSTYYRSLIPEYSDRNIIFYLIDLNDDTAIQTIITLNDLTGEYTNATGKVVKPIGGVSTTIIEQEFDIESRIVLYLLKDSLYTLCVKDNDLNERCLGDFVADAASSKTITLPEITFIPDDSVLGDGISWEWNETNESIRLYYVDTGSNSEYLNFTVYNGTNTTEILYSIISEDVGSILFTYTTIANQSYLVCIEGTVGGYGKIEQCTTFLRVSRLGDWQAYEEDDIKEYLEFFVAICIGLLAFAIGKFAGAGTTICAFLWFFIRIGWLDLGSELLNQGGLGVLIAFAIFSVWSDFNKRG